MTGWRPPFVGTAMGVTENLRERRSHAPNATPRLAALQRWGMLAFECDWDHRPMTGARFTYLRGRDRANVADAAIFALIGA